MFSSPVIVQLRGVTRKLGLNRLISRLMSRGRYEDQFGPALKAEIRPGDTVWDIGANLGLYTQEFLTAAGPTGRVVAFEPVPSCFDRLRERFAGSGQVKLINAAVGEHDGEIAMSLDPDPLAATHRIGGPVAGGGQPVLVPIRSAASVAAEAGAWFPTVVKIDVEGHEGAVLDGMVDLLKDPRLRCIGVEVHFGLLAERGEPNRPKEMEATLRQHGYRLRWTDPSHLIALR